MEVLFKKDKIVLLLISIIVFIYYMTTGEVDSEVFKTMGWFGLVSYLYSIISWLKKGNQLISPYIIFFTCLYIFSFGQSFLYAFGIEFERDLLYFPDINSKGIRDAQFVTIEMLLMFQIGASCVNNKIKRERDFLLNTERILHRLRKIGWFFFSFSVYFYFQRTITNLFLSMTKGYSSLYEQEELIGVDNMAKILADFFIPSIICLFISYKDNKKIRNLLILILGVNILFNLLIGGRSDAVILIALLLIMYNYLVKKFSRKWFILGTFGVVFLLQILSYISHIRNDTKKSINNIEMENNAVVDALSEMGGTAFCLIKSMDLVPIQYDYRYGKSYVYSITTLIPNLGFWDIHPARKESNLGDWLTEVLNLGYGTGFSMTAEAYVNFGYLGIFFFFFWGVFIAKLFGRFEISNQQRNYALLAFVLIMFWFCLKLPRNNFINLIRPLFFIAIPVYLYCINFKLFKK